MLSSCGVLILLVPENLRRQVPATCGQMLRQITRNKPLRSELRTSQTCLYSYNCFFSSQAAKTCANNMGIKHGSYKHCFIFGKLCIIFCQIKHVMPKLCIRRRSCTWHTLIPELNIQSRQINRKTELLVLFLA